MTEHSHRQQFPITLNAFIAGAELEAPSIEYQRRLLTQTITRNNLLMPTGRACSLIRGFHHTYSMA